MRRVKLIGVHRGGQENGLRDVRHALKNVILSFLVGLHHLLGDTHGLVLDQATGLDLQLQEGLVVPVQV